MFVADYSIPLNSQDDSRMTTMHHEVRLKAFALALLTFSASGTAAEREMVKKPPPDPTRDAVMMSAGFLSAHPDLRFRLHGLKELNSNNAEDAFGYFQRASYYGDKPSQGMVAEMLWEGRGVAQDRALAYAWMDLAAERGYEGFTILRERYWKALTDSDRLRAVEAGQDVYARYGDDAASPRLATVLRRERGKQTGSRTGFTGSLKILVPGPGGEMLQIDGSDYYDKRYWDPREYRAWHDSVWTKPRTGRVDVGDVVQVEDSPTSRIPASAPATDTPEPQSPEPDDGNPGTRPQP